MEYIPGACPNDCNGYRIPLDLYLQSVLDILMKKRALIRQAPASFNIAGPGTFISVIVPVFNEEGVIEEFHCRLMQVIDGLDVHAEIIYINDGSTDNTMNIIGQLRKKDANVGILDLSRNFGKEAAITAGLDYANGEAVIIIDADLQDPPELMPEMLHEWENGYEVVYMERRSRTGETIIKKLTARIFYSILARLGSVPIPKNVGDFRLLSRRVVEALRLMPERTRFMKGLFAWVGFHQKGLKYDRDARASGKSKWSYWSLFKFSLEGITSFSTIPLHLASCLGVLAASTAFLYGMWIILKTLLFGESVRGYPSLMVVILFLAGIQLIAVGIVGQYLGRMFIESKQRPLYIIKDFWGVRPAVQKKWNRL